MSTMHLDSKAIFVFKRERHTEVNNSKEVVIRKGQDRTKQLY